ncbi:hypothetical protein [Rhizobium sp.]|jgi:hypothetical protein|uniref:hypothetical protein n=1 Tax=Rhizobium sp. TaxID=391 RepID=UPI000E82E64A|nr:hypothetical protein [Rhizobium sp.]
MSKTYLYLIIALLISIAGTASYVFVIQPTVKDDAELRRRAENMFPSGTKHLPTTGGKEIGVEF